MDAVFDISKVDELHGRLVRMAKVNAQKTMRKFWAASMKDMESALKEKVSSLFPYGRRKNSGMLRGKKYGPLADDISSKVFSRGGGGVIYIFRNNQGRQCVLRWLDSGTNDRGDKRSVYEGGMFKEHTMSGTGINKGFRSKIAPRNFFEPTMDKVSSSIIQKRVEDVSKEIANEIIKAGQ